MRPPPAPPAHWRTCYDAAYYRGHGANTVNVLLVDIRAWDTLGEISVLVVAATGVASMVFRHRRFGSAPRVPKGVPTTPDVTWLRGSGMHDPRHRSLVLEVATRLVFPLIMMLGVLLLRRTQRSPAVASPAGSPWAWPQQLPGRGRYELGETLPLDAGKVLGAGLTPGGRYRRRVAGHGRTRSVQCGTEIHAARGGLGQDGDRPVLRSRCT